MFVISHELSSRVQTHICTKCIYSYEFTKQKGNSLIGQSLNKDYMGEFDMKRMVSDPMISNLFKPFNQSDLNYKTGQVPLHN